MGEEITHSQQIGLEFVWKHTIFKKLDYEN
jgi:hypothetical protein